MDFIRERGSPNALLSDGAKTELIKKIVDVLRHHHIKGKQSESQNPSERRIQDVKHVNNTIMEITDIPAKFWLLAALFVVYHLICCASKSIDNMPPPRKSY